MLTEELAREFLDCPFGSADEIVQYFDCVLGRNDMSKMLHFDDLLDNHKRRVLVGGLDAMTLIAKSYSP